MASNLDVLDGHNVVDPAYVENSTGKWLCDGWTAYQWALHGLAIAQERVSGDMSSDVAMAISGALQALDNNEEEYSHD